MSLSAILITATVTVFAFAVGEAIEPALRRGTRNVLLSPFVLVANIYRNRVEMAKLILQWGGFFAAIIAIVLYFNLS